MSLAVVFSFSLLLVVLLLMLVELRISRSNERTLRSLGAVDADDGVYRSMRWAYPRGVHALLDRWGTRAASAPSPAPIASLHRPTVVAEAVEALGRDREAAVVGGGTDLLPLIEQGLSRPRKLVDLGGVATLAGIRETDAGDLLVGAGVTLADLARWPGVDPLIRRVVASIASPQIRERRRRTQASMELPDGMGVSCSSFVRGTRSSASGVERKKPPFRSSPKSSTASRASRFTSRSHSSSPVATCSSSRPWATFA